MWQQCARLAALHFLVAASLQSFLPLLWQLSVFDAIDFKSSAPELGWPCQWAQMMCGYLPCSPRLSRGYRVAKRAQLCCSRQWACQRRRSGWLMLPAGWQRIGKHLHSTVPLLWAPQPTWMLLPSPSTCQLCIYYSQGSPQGRSLRSGAGGGRKFSAPPLRSRSPPSPALAQAPSQASMARKSADTCQKSANGKGLHARQ